MANTDLTSIRDALTRVITPREIRRLARRNGAVKRRRKVDIAAFVYALVLGFSTGSERSIAGLRRVFERAARTRLAPSAFYDRFNRALVRTIEQVPPKNAPSDYFR